MNVTGLPAPPPRTPAVHAVIHGVHGSPGRTGWKAFYTRRQLQSPTEAVEWATLPPDAVSGEHRHTRTEEIYLVLDGEGEFFFNGRPHAVRRGSLALTPPGNTHGLRNTGDHDLSWWVVETLAPATQAALAAPAPPGPVTPRSRPVPVHLTDLTVTPHVDTTTVFDGPLVAVDRHVLLAGEELVTGADSSEIAGFVNAGSVVLDLPGATSSVTAPVAFLVPAGARGRLTAAEDCELFTVELRVGPA